MKLAELNFSHFAVYWAIILAAIIIITLRVARFLVPAILPKKSNRARVLKYFPLAETLIWMFYSIWSIQFFMKNNQFFAFFEMLIFVLAGVLVFWFVLRDFFSGLLFRLEDKLQKGDTIQFKEYRGTITELGSRKIEIETPDGKKALIPYSAVFSQIIVKDDNAEMISSYQFRVEIANTTDVNKIIENTSSRIMALPWSSLKKSPILQVVGETKDQITIEITVYPVDKRYFYRIEQQIRADLADIQTQNKKKISTL